MKSPDKFTLTTGQPILRILPTLTQAFDRGVLFLGCGPSTVRICPALIVTKDEADVAVDVLEECIRIVGKDGNASGL